MIRTELLVCLGVGLLMGAPPAQARQEFRELIAARLGAPRGTPACGVCHLGGKTTGATAYTAFAWSMRAHGLTGEASSVVPAIDALETDKVDSDGDGVPDTTEITRGTDPNEPGTATDIQDPQLGCRVGAPVRPGAAPALLVGVFLWLSRKRRAPR